VEGRRVASQTRGSSNDGFDHLDLDDEDL